MRRFVYTLVERLTDPDAGLSRNRHFALFDSPAGRRALRVARHLRSLVHDLSEHAHEAAISVRKRDHGIELQVSVPSRRLVRTSFLSMDDLAVLSRQPGPLAGVVEGLLRAARGELPEGETGS